jgi:hypothetical protein
MVQTYLMPEKFDAAEVFRPAGKAGDTIEARLKPGKEKPAVER